MEVELITYTMGCEDVVERAAAVCYDSKPTKGYRIAASCARSGHMSVWEHLNVTFHISGVSRALLAQSWHSCRDTDTSVSACGARGTAARMGSAM